MGDRVLDEGDDIGLGDLARDEIGEYEGACGVQRLFKGVGGVAWSMDTLWTRTGPVAKVLFHR